MLGLAGPVKICCLYLNTLPLPFFKKNITNYNNAKCNNCAVGYKTCIDRIIC